MNLRSLVQLIAQREIMYRLKDRGYLVSTAFLLVVTAVSVTVPLLLEQGGKCTEQTVGTVGAPADRIAQQAVQLGRTACTAAKADAEPSSSTSEAAPSSGSSSSSGVSPAVVRSADSGIPAVTLTVRQFPDVAAAEAAVRDGTVDAALVPGTTAGEPVLVGQSAVPAEIAELVTRARGAERLNDALTGSGVDPAVVRQAIDTGAPAQRLLDPNADKQQFAVLLGFVFTMLTFLSVYVFGVLIAQSVVEEKQSRIVELLVAAVPVRALLLGKVAGNTVLAAGQLVLLLAVGLAGASIGGQTVLVSLLLRSSGWFLLFFLLGFVMLSCLWAGAGALASRQEDLQSTMMPLNLLVMVPFFVSIYVTGNGLWLTVLSYLPFTSPMVMPRRVATGDAAWWEALISAGIIVLTAMVLVAAGARLYERTLLRIGAKGSWREIWSRAA